MRAVKFLVVGAVMVVASFAVVLHGRALHLRAYHGWRVGHRDGVVAGLAAVAQGRRASPHESTTATIDGSEITITYGRPYMRGREIFGRLVPYGRVWCPGADEATTIESARDLQLATLSVPAGPHTIWLLPTRDKWTLIVSKEPSGFHTNYNASADLGRVEMMKKSLDMPVEQLTFAIVKNSSGAGGLVMMAWEKTEASVPFTVQ